MSEASAGAFERMLRRDRLVVVLGLAGAVAISWLYLLWHAGMDMTPMDGMSMAATATPQWTPGYAGMMLTMWAVMMVAMMLPGAAPMVLLHAGIARRRAEGGPVAATTFFVLGYVAVWGAFGAGATLVQYLLAEVALISPAMRTTSAVLAGVLLIGAGVWQWTPLKDVCLRHCRSPLGFLLTYWRDGAGGAYAMGLRHGGYCLGCCWALMLLLFVGGVMNLLWVAGLALLVLAEKVAPGGRWLGRATGVVLVVWGAGVLSGMA